MTNLDLFLAPLLVGGIAALTLTGHAFEKPRELREKYLKIYEAELSATQSDFNRHIIWEKHPKLTALFIKSIKGILIFDIFEAIIITLYVLVELLILFICVYPNPIDSIKTATHILNPCLGNSVCSLCTEQIKVMFLGYGLLCLGLIMTGLMSVYCILVIPFVTRNNLSNQKVLVDNIDTVMKRKRERLTGPIS